MAGNESRPFVDTNVLYSGFHNPKGAPGRIVDAHMSGRITLVISRLVLDELLRTIRSKRPALLPDVRQFLTEAPPEVCPDPTVDAVSQARAWIHPNDAPILAPMMTSGADCLVTGNSRHFTADVARRAGVRIVSPADYVAEYLHR